MAEYIKREELIKRLGVTPILKYGIPTYTRDGVIDLVEKQPAADVVEVVHGRWVDHMCRDWRCSECGEKIHKVRNVDGYCYDDKPNYCPNCGARMDGD